MSAPDNPIAAFGVALPFHVDQEVVAFMRAHGRALFTAKMLHQVVAARMASANLGHALPEQWPRRVVDQLIQREKAQGNIELYGPGRGAGAFWHWIKCRETER